MEKKYELSDLEMAILFERFILQSNSKDTSEKLKITKSELTKYESSALRKLRHQDDIESVIKEVFNYGKGR